MTLALSNAPLLMFCRFFPVPIHGRSRHVASDLPHKYPRKFALDSHQNIVSRYGTRYDITRTA